MLFFLTVAGNYFVSCDDNTGSLGYDIVPNTDLVDNNFTVLNVKTSSYEVGIKFLQGPVLLTLGNTLTLRQVR